MAKATKQRVVTKKRMSYKPIATAVLATAVIGYGIYASVASSSVSDEYLLSLRTDAMKLKKQFKALEVSSAAKSFDSPDAPIEQYAKDFDTAEQRINELRTSLAEFEKKHTANTMAPFTRALPLYDEVNKSHDDARYMVSQTMSVLDDYQRLISSLRTMNQLELSLENGLNEVNAVNDFNMLIFKGSIYREKAAVVRQRSDATAGLTLPIEYRAYRTGLIERADAYATSLQSLARGLDIASDSVIYGSTAQIEQITERYFSIDKQNRFDANQKSLTLKQVGEVTEKLDAFDPAESSD